MCLHIVWTVHTCNFVKVNHSNQKRTVFLYCFVSEILINYNTGTSGTTTVIVYICRLHVSTYTQVIFRPSCTCETIKSYARWDPIVLTCLKHINYIKLLCLSIKVKIRIALFTLRWYRIRYADLSYMDALWCPIFKVLLDILRWVSVRVFSLNAVVPDILVF